MLSAQSRGAALRLLSYWFRSMTVMSVFRIPVESQNYQPNDCVTGEAPVVLQCLLVCVWLTDVFSTLVALVRSTNSHQNLS